MKPVRVIQVGLGPWGQSWVRDVLSAQKAVDVVAYVDRDPARLGDARCRFGLSGERCFTSLDVALDETDAEAVLVITTMGTHVPVIRTSLEADKHVLTEKPFAMDVQDAKELVDLAEAGNRILMVSQNYRWYPAVRVVRETLSRGELGRVLGVNVDFRKPPGRRPRQGPSRLLFDMAVHHMDLLRAILGTELTQVVCWPVDPDWRSFEETEGVSLPLAVSALLRYGGEIPVSYRFSWMSHDTPTTWGGDWSIEGELGTLRWTCRGDQGADQDEVTLSRVGEAPQRLELPSLAHFGRAGCLRAFERALRTGAEPETSGRDNLHTLQAIHALIQSVRSGTAVELHQ